MATPPEQPWSNFEKSYLLAEIIKAANLPPDVLFNVIRNLNIQPRWEDTAFPMGRSMNSSRFAFDDMRRTLSMQQPMGAPMVPLTPTPLSAPVTLKRSFPYEGSYSAGATGREIRPKPSMVGGVYSQPSPTEPPPKKKRGRPTKAEAQAKADAAAAAASSGGDTGEAAAPQAAAPRLSVQTSASTAIVLPAASATASEEAKPTFAPSSRMPIAAMLTPAAREPKSSSYSSSSSSGKRRPARSTKLEQEETPVTGQYESPYARVRAAAEDSPARTAVLRHREDQAILSRSASGGPHETTSTTRTSSDPPPPAPPQ